MSTPASQTSGPAHGNHGGAKPASDPIQHTVAAFVAVPQKMMQINLAVANHAFSFMNRRMKAQAALWTSIGQSGSNGGAAEVQRAFLETVTKDYTDEMTQLTNMARKNLALITETVASAPLPGLPVSRSS